MELSGNFAQRLMWVIWPAFLVAGVATAIFFTMVDPADLTLFGVQAELPREAVYTVGFFAFWVMGVASSALTVFLERSPWEVNRCPMEPAARPDGCPKRSDEEPCRASGDVVSR